MTAKQEPTARILTADSYHHLRRIIVSSVVLLLSLLIIFFALGCYKDYQEIITHTEAQTKSYARALKEHAERTFSETDLVIHTTIQQIESQGGLKRFHQAALTRLLTAMSKNIPQIASLSITDATGQMIATSLPAPGELPNLANRELFRFHRDNTSDELFINPPFKSRITGKWRFTLSRRINTSTGSFSGIVLAAIEINYFEKLYLSLVTGNNGRFSLASLAGDYLVLVPSSESVYQKRKKTAAFFREMVKSTPENTYHNRSSNIAKEYRIVSFHRLDKYPVVAIMSFGRDRILSGWRASVIKRGAIICILSLSIIVLTRLLLRQLRLLDQKVQDRTSQLSLSNRFLEKEIQDRRQIEVNLLEHQQKLERMAIELSLAEERERGRIAGELHDQVGQRLILCKIKLDGLAVTCTNRESLQTVTELEGLVEQSIQDIRTLTFQLRPHMLASAGLFASLQWLGAELERDYGLQVEITLEQHAASVKHLRYEIRPILFYATRELLLNVIKHSGVNKARVLLQRTADLLEISVTDTGSGFTVDHSREPSSRQGGFGLYNLKQKLEYLGGKLLINTQPEQGTSVTISFPLHEGLLEE